MDGVLNVTAEQVDSVARICHEANRAYCVMTGDPGLPAWDELEEGYRESTRSGVRMAVSGSTPEESHHGWIQERLSAGWKYGQVLDRAAKIHPNLVPYDNLPESQRRKDALFLGIVAAILGPPR